MTDGTGRPERAGAARLVPARVGLVLAVALAVVATAVWGIPSLREPLPMPSRALGAWVFAVNVDPPPGWTLTAHGVSAELESLTLQYQVSECQVKAALPSAPAGFRAALPAAGEPVRVDGRPAQYSTAFPSATAYPSDGAADVGVRMAYGDGGVLDVVCDLVMAELTGVPIRALVLDVAERLRLSTGEPLLLPFTVDRVPPGLQIVTVEEQNGAEQLLLTTGEPAFPRQAVGVEVTPHRPSVRGQPTLVDGGPAELWLGSGFAQLCRRVDPQFVCVQLTDGTIPLEDPEAPAARRGAALITDVMLSVRLAPDLEDRGTWFTAEDALPS